MKLHAPELVFALPPSIELLLPDAKFLQPPPMIEESPEARLKTPAIIPALYAVEVVQFT